MKPKLSEIKTELDLRHPLDFLTKHLLKSAHSIENFDDFISCGDTESEPLIFRENLHLVLKSWPKLKSHDGVKELIDQEIAHLIDEEISLAENCNFYTYQDIPKELGHKSTDGLMKSTIHHQKMKAVVLDSFYKPV